MPVTADAHGNERLRVFASLHDELLTCRADSIPAVKIESTVTQWLESRLEKFTSPTCFSVEN